MTRLSHGFSVEHAEKYGIDCAILISHFQFWIEQNATIGRNFYDGRTWMYQTQNEIAACYPYWNRDKVQEILKKLIDFGVIIKGNYNKTAFDKTLWYAFENEKMFTKAQNRTIECAESRNPLCETAHTIPDTNPVAKTKKTTATPKPAAAVFSEKAPQKTKPNVYPILDLVDIPIHDKEEITRDYDEESAIHAVRYALHPKTVINRSLPAILKWACKIKPEIAPSNAEVAAEKAEKASAEKEKKIAAHREYASKYHEKKVDGIEILAYEDRIRIGGVGKKTTIYYYENGFKEQMHSALRKENFPILEES